VESVENFVDNLSPYVFACG